jgi:hypothetical protein
MKRLLEILGDVVGLTALLTILWFALFAAPF